MRRFSTRLRWLYRSRAASLSRRMAALTALSAGISVLIISISAHFVTRWSLYSQLDRELTETAAYMAGSIGTDLENMSGLNAGALKAANTTLMVERADGQVIRIPGETVQLVPSHAEMAVARTGFGSSARTGETTDGVRYRMVAVPLNISGANYALILAKPLAPTEATLNVLTGVLLWVGATGLGISILIGWSAGRSIMAPLRKLTKAVAHVTETDELTPIPIHSDDELGNLTRSFNTMLNSLASSRERQRRLIADAGHELRTPLTSMRTNVELMIADEKSNMLPEGARHEILHDVAAQLGEFTSLVGDLVQLSRDEQVVANPMLLDLAEVVDGAVVRAKRRGPNLTFTVQLHPHYLIGEADTLGRAFTNLLDNAVKFSPPDGKIFVVMDGESVMVADEGPGIAEEDLPKVFDRFYRSDQARNTPGTGLGLSIVAHTIASHGGTVEAGRSDQGGAKFTVHLPSVDPDAEDILLEE